MVNGRPNSSARATFSPTQSMRSGQPRRRSRRRSSRMNITNARIAANRSRKPFSILLAAVARGSISWMNKQSRELFFLVSESSSFLEEASLSSSAPMRCRTVVSFRCRRNAPPNLCTTPIKAERFFQVISATVGDFASRFLAKSTMLTNIYSPVAKEIAPPIYPICAIDRPQPRERPNWPNEIVFPPVGCHHVLESHLSVEVWLSARSSHRSQERLSTLHNPHH